MKILVEEIHGHISKLTLEVNIFSVLKIVLEKKSSLINRFSTYNIKLLITFIVFIYISHL